MRPGFINGEKLHREEADRVTRWMRANGLRHWVPEDARIVITGNRFTVETFDIERMVPRPAPRRRGDPRPWYRAKADRWFRQHGYELPRRTRTYRIRHNLKDFK